MTPITARTTIGEWTVEPATVVEKGKAVAVLSAKNAKEAKEFIFEPTCSKETVQTFLELSAKDRGASTRFGDWKNSPYIRANVPEKDRALIDGGYPLPEEPKEVEEK